MTATGWSRRCGTLVAAVLFSAAPAVASPSLYPTGTTIYDPAKAFNSFVLFNGPDQVAYLIDMDGTVVRT